MLQAENLELKRRKSDKGETLEWTDYMSLRFTQHVRTFIHFDKKKRNIHSQ
jgi:steroid 3-oxidase